MFKGWVEPAAGETISGSMDSKFLKECEVFQGTGCFVENRTLWRRKVDRVAGVSW